VQYELRYRVIEAKRNTYQNIIDRLGDQPASRYLEGTLDVQPRENFHYRPTWAPGRELYDPRFTALRLTDSYSFTDPRQYYYTPYVTQRSSLHDEFGKTLAYLQDRELLARLPETWHTMLTSVVVPLRHYESAAQLVSVAGARFADGTSIEQCCTFAAFDRIGNAQMLSRMGIELDSGHGGVLDAAKQNWLDAEHLQPLRRLAEEIMVTSDWAEGLLAADLVDSLIYPLLYQGLDEAALLGGAGAYSLLAQHFTAWFADQRKWIDALTRTWAEDPANGEDNRTTLARIVRTWQPRARGAVAALATAIDSHEPGVRATEVLADIAGPGWAQPAGGVA
jgi:phenol/toluene 2-monooxygenase (NADH) P1/A1